MKIVMFSDTHRQHKKVNIPNGDMLIFAGDGDWYTKNDFITFIDWVSEKPHPYKIIISGNHDFLFDNSTEINKTIYIKECFTRGIIYLENSGIEIDGYNIWGSPFTPIFYDWAFMRKRGEDITKVWNQIPDNTDILITHGPPKYILDKVHNGLDSFGCEDLSNAIERVKPKLHVFGHIHSASGLIKVDNTMFCNASILDESYTLAYKARVINLPDIKENI